MKRRDLLKSTIAAPAMLAGATGTASEAEAAPKLRGKNFILFITDQERAVQHFPSGWLRKNMPATQRLLRNGISFDRAFCSSCMCSPSRASMLTGYFPAQHGVVDTLSFDSSYSAGEAVLPADLPNLATVFKAAGYNVAYKGKWHLSKPVADPTDDHAWTPADTRVYGFNWWDPPDAGGNQEISEFGGGRAAHDRRFIRQPGRPAAGDEGALAYLRRMRNSDKPFFLVVSLVNPHDVLGYPRTYRAGGYRGGKWLKGTIGLPPTWNEDLSTKPSAHAAMIQPFNQGMGPLNTRKRRLAYLNFYGNLIKETDRYLGDILDALDDTGLTDDTVVIKTSDHGEMGLAHGGLRQKSFNFYEETLRVPMIYSNPKLFPRTRRSKALVSHVDLLPTLASLVHAPKGARAKWQGKDYSRIVLGKGGPVQDYVVFTYDDVRMGQDTAALVPPPNRIISIREGRYKLARYYDGDGVVPDQWEMYDLQQDAHERINLAAPGYVRTPEQQAQLDRLTAKLATVTATRLQPI